MATQELTEQDADALFWTMLRYHKGGVDGVCPGGRTASSLDVFLAKRRLRLRARTEDDKNGLGLQWLVEPEQPVSEVDLQSLPRSLSVNPAADAEPEGPPFDVPEGSRKTGARASRVGGLSLTKRGERVSLRLSPSTKKQLSISLRSAGSVAYQLQSHWRNKDMELSFSQPLLPETMEDEVLLASRTTTLSDDERNSKNQLELSKQEATAVDAKGTSPSKIPVCAASRATPEKPHQAGRLVAATKLGVTEPGPPSVFLVDAEKEALSSKLTCGVPGTKTKEMCRSFISVAEGTLRLEGEREDHVSVLPQSGQSKAPSSSALLAPLESTQTQPAADKRSKGNPGRLPPCTDEVFDMLARPLNWDEEEEGIHEAVMFVRSAPSLPPHLLGKKRPDVELASPPSNSGVLEWSRSASPKKREALIQSPQTITRLRRERKRKRSSAPARRARPPTALLSDPASPTEDEGRGPSDCSPAEAKEVDREKKDLPNCAVRPELQAFTAAVLDSLSERSLRRLLVTLAWDEAFET
ncbi:hypothetical protein CSUI_001085 [Cystoisospora suis]|uniref:Uncharacterized protein n=1 Tax=Cystoisospora suis TaxID=483139 RepID=A0A2C6LEH2_9APIC|nr:hypothetical protein CSUI_001085 [Cystoisospora suis]